MDWSEHDEEWPEESKEPAGTSSPPSRTHRAPSEPCSELENTLQRQIDLISDARTNATLHQWWNWNPDNGHREVQRGECVQIGSQLLMELIVADPHDRVIQSCREWFASLGLPRPSLHQAPIQQVLLRSLHGNHAPDDHRFLVFGAYGNGQAESGLQKQLVEAFPEQMRSLRAQAGGGFPDFAQRRTAKQSWEDAQKLNMANRGRVWVAEPDPSNPVLLVACAAYPRCQDPSEEVHVSRMFRAALDAIVEVIISGVPYHGGPASQFAGEVAIPGVAASGAASSPSEPSRWNPEALPMASVASGLKRDADYVDAATSKTQPLSEHDGARPARTLRVFTHALGSFLGHSDPELFGKGLAVGFRDFIAGTVAKP